MSRLSESHKNKYMEAWTYVKQSNEIYDCEETQNQNHLAPK